MSNEIFVPQTELERKNVMALAEYLGDIYYC
jgi:hypothetical protein